MTLWWIGNIVFLFVVIPLVVFLLHKLREPVIEIRSYAADALEHGVLAIAALDATEELLTTRERVATLKGQLAAYGGVVDELL